MFAYCSKLQVIDISNFDTRGKSSSEMNSAFYDCPELKIIYIGDNWVMPSGSYGKWTEITVKNKNSKV